MASIDLCGLPYLVGWSFVDVIVIDIWNLNQALILCGYQY